MVSTFSRSLICLVLVCLGNTIAKKLPSYITPCHVNDPNINECFKKAALTVQKRMLNGIPELQIPPMNPLVLPEVSLNSGSSFKATFRNIEIFYADQFQIDDLNVDLPRNHVDMRITFPKLRIRSQYDVDGKILILELKGNGPADGNYTNVRADLIIDGKRYTKNGKEYLRFDDKSLSLSLGKPVLRFDKLFGDNEELNEQTNKIVNDNIEGIIDELKPVINDAVTQFVFGLVNRLFEKYSFDELFPK